MFFSPTMEIIPAICERRNGFRYYFIVLSVGEKKRTWGLPAPKRGPLNTAQGLRP